MSEFAYTVIFRSRDLPKMIPQHVHINPSTETIIKAETASKLWKKAIFPKLYRTLRCMIFFCRPF